MKKINKKRLKNAMMREDFVSFLQKAFQTLNPGVEYSHNWHIDLIADYLHQILSGKTRRLIINMPPRYLKSTCISVAFPAWLLGRDPTKKIIVASYSQVISNKHSLDTRVIMQSAWYKELFPGTVICKDQNEKHKFKTTENGFRFATSIGGSLVGEGGDILIMDDPHNPSHIMHEDQRSSVHNWFDQYFMSRLDSKKTGVILLVMQRLHRDDLSGYVLKKKNKYWEHLCLQAVSEDDIIISMGDKTYARKRDSLLHKEREGENEIEKMKIDLGSYGFATQYQQSPPDITGNEFIKREWFRRYEFLPTENIRIIQSWDTAITCGENSDFSACTTWVIDLERRLYLSDVWRGKLDYVNLRNKISQEHEKYNAAIILIENKASGQTLIQERMGEIPILGITPKESKEQRVSSTLSLIESGSVLLPNRISWLSCFENEICSFPNAKYDDQVDSMTQFLLWYKNTNLNKNLRMQSFSRNIW